MNEPILDRPVCDTDISLGKRLAKARKTRGWTPGYVSNQLHLPESTIDALEADDYSRLPAEVYVKGYLRNYARLLRLPADEIIQAYVERHAAAVPVGGAPAAFSGKSIAPAVRPAGAQPPLLRGSRELGRERRANHRHYGLLLWAGAALVLAYAATWLWPDARDTGINGWFDGFRSEVGAPAADVQSEPAGQQHSPISSDVPGVDASSLLPTAPDQSEAAPADPLQSANMAPAVTAAANVLQGSVSSESRVDTLNLRFDGESWATVVDADGKRLMHQTGTKGTAKTLTGKAPFNLTIGRIADVSIEFNGQPFEFPNAKKRATERFSIPLAPKDQQRLSRN